MKDQNDKSAALCACPGTGIRTGNQDHFFPLRDLLDEALFFGAFLALFLAFLFGAAFFLAVEVFPKSLITIDVKFCLCPILTVCLVLFLYLIPFSKCRDFYGREH